MQKFRAALAKIWPTEEAPNEQPAVDTGSLPRGGASPGQLAYVPNSTTKVCQLTSDFDPADRVPTLSQTGQRFGIIATDLGNSFEHKGKLYFLFGDTKGRPGDWDALAWTDSTDPERIRLDFHRGRDGKWLPPRVPGISQGPFEVPSYGVSIGDTMYVAFTTDHSIRKAMGRSVLAASQDDGRSFTEVCELSRDKFINVSFWLADGWLYIYGSGEYRRSSVCLARVRASEIGNRSQWQYFSGLGPEGQTVWAPSESEVALLFHHEVVGEFSVAYLGPVQRYVMLYNSTDPRGIVMRSAETPWGPWSQGTVIYEPWRDKGYGRFMHISAKFEQAGDTFSDPNREDEWGGEYGPYIMARYTSGSDRQCRIYYTMSTWNPYQVVVMRSDLRLGLERPEEFLA